MQGCTFKKKSVVGVLAKKIVRFSLVVIINTRPCLVIGYMHIVKSHKRDIPVTLLLGLLGLLGRSLVGLGLVKDLKRLQRPGSSLAHYGPVG